MRIKTEMRELIENSIISSYLKIADAIAEGSMGQKRLGRKFKSKKVKNKAALARKFDYKVKQGKKRDFERGGEGDPAEYDNELDSRGFNRMLGISRGAKHQYRSDNYYPNYDELKESVTRSVIECYSNIADAIAEGSSSRKKMDRALKSIMKKGDKAVASAKTPRDRDKVKDKVVDKLHPLIMRGEYKQHDGEGRARAKLNVVKKAEEQGQDVKAVMAEIPTGKNDSTQRAGRQLKMTRKGEPGARISGRVINRAQQYPTNIHRDVAMDKEHSTEEKRRNRAATERFERIKRRARWN